MIGKRGKNVKPKLPGCVMSVCFIRVAFGGNLSALSRCGTGPQMAKRCKGCK
jgi:hypothetical protein